MWRPKWVMGKLEFTASPLRLSGLEDFSESGADFGGGRRDGHAHGLHLGDFLLRGAAGLAFDDRSGVPHALARGRGLAGDEPDDGLGHLLLDDSGGSMVWTTASGRCTPDFFWGITVGSDSISFVGSAADESMPGGATYRLRVQKTRVYLPATATVGDPRCVSVPEDCCEDNVTGGVDLTCCTGKRYGKTLYIGLSNVIGCDSLEGFVIPINFDPVNGGQLGVPGWGGAANYDQDGFLTCSMEGHVYCGPDNLLRMVVGLTNQGGGATRCFSEIIVDFSCPTEPLFYETRQTFTMIQEGLGTPCRAL
jgi:hypothetical protein